MEGDLTPHSNETMQEICIGAHRRRALANLIAPEGKTPGRQILLSLSVLKPQGEGWWEAGGSPPPDASLLTPAV